MRGRFDTTCASTGGVIPRSILDPSFRYTASFNTDLQKTFARIRCEQRKDAEGAVQATGDAPVKVSSIVGKTATGR